MSCVSAEPVGGEDNADSGPESSRHLPLVWGGEERGGECDHEKLQQRERERETVIHYLQIQSRVWPTNTLVLISVITLNNINSPGHESEDIGLRLNFLHQRATVLL